MNLPHPTTTKPHKFGSKYEANVTSGLKTSTSASDLTARQDLKEGFTDSLSALTTLRLNQSLGKHGDSPLFNKLWSSPVLPKPASPVSTRLEEFLHDCFTAAINKSLLSAERLAVVLDFHKYLQELHCHENLAFIIEIYKYEYFYEKIYGSRNGGKDDDEGFGRIRSINSDFLNLSLEQYIDNMPYPTSSMRRSVRRNSLRSRSSQSINNPDPFPLDFDEPAGVAAVWDSFCDRNLSSESEEDWVLEPDPTNSDDSSTEELLSEQWSYIISNFIAPNSPSQINLCDKTVDFLMNCEAIKDRVHNPLVLQRVKSEVVLILRENAFDSFIRKENCQDSNVFDRLYSSSVPALTVTSPIGSHVTSHMSTHTQASSSSHSRDRTSQASSSHKNRIVSPRGAASHHSQTESTTVSPVVAPVPSKRRPKFFSAFANNSSSEGLSSPSSSFTGLLGLLKPTALAGHGRVAYSAPQSPSPSSARSRAVTPSSLLDVGEGLARPESSTSDGQQSPSILNKLWRKKK